MESLSQREPGVAAELDADHALFQLPGRHSPRHLHHQQRGITEPVAAQDQEVDHADSSLARSFEPLHDSVAGTDAGTGENYAMKTAASTSPVRGRGIAPSPDPIPKNKPGRLHKSLDTPAPLAKRGRKTQPLCRFRFNDPPPIGSQLEHERPPSLSWFPRYARRCGFLFFRYSSSFYLPVTAHPYLGTCGCLCVCLRRQSMSSTLMHVR